MIFVNIGNHDQEFNRLIMHIDKIAPLINEKIIVQKGYTSYVPKNCESFDFKKSLVPYLKKARLIISHAGSGAFIESAKLYNRPLIIVPRKYKLGEHINNHQIEFAEKMERIYGVKVIYNISDLTPELLKDYRKVIRIDNGNLERMQRYLRKLIDSLRRVNVSN